MPSSGSTTQRRPLLPARSPPSSPRIAVVGPRGGEPLADQPLGGVVGLGDEVGRARLGGHVHEPGRRTPRAVAAPASRATDSAIARNRDHSAGRRSAQSARGLELCRQRQQRGLVVARRDELHREREAVGREARRDRGRRLAGVVVRARSTGRTRIELFRTISRRPALVLADRRRAAREHRREHEVGPRRPQLLPVGGGRRLGALDHRLRDRAADAQRSHGSGATAARGAEARGRSRRSRADNARRRR